MIRWMEREENGMRESHVVALSNHPQSSSEITIGIDLGDRWSRYCFLDGRGNVVEEDRGPHNRGSSHAAIPANSGAHRDRSRHALAVGKSAAGEPGPPGNRGQCPQGTTDL